MLQLIITKRNRTQNPNRPDKENMMATLTATTDRHNMNFAQYMETLNAATQDVIRRFIATPELYKTAERAARQSAKELRDSDYRDYSKEFSELQTFYRLMPIKLAFQAGRHFASVSDATFAKVDWEQVYKMASIEIA